MLPILLLLIAACQPDMAAWRARVAAAGVQHFKGSWTVVLRRDEAADTLVPHQVAGDIAITVNTAAIEAPGFPDRPLFFGSYAIRFDSLGFVGGTTADVPDLAGTIIGDSLVLILAPSSDEPIELRGLAAGDSVVGRWHAHRRAAEDATGDFQLRRHRRDT